MLWRKTFHFEVGMIIICCSTFDQANMQEMDEMGKKSENWKVTFDYLI